MDINEKQSYPPSESAEAKNDINFNASSVGAIIAREALTARVFATHRDRYEVVCERGAGFARLKKSEYYSGNELFPTVGDYVALDWQDGAESRITKTLPRKTCFYRLDPSSPGIFRCSYAPPKRLRGIYAFSR